MSDETSFEYDEGIESDEQSFESDESYGYAAAGEDVESDEAMESDESDESDEFYAPQEQESDEAFEASEAFESDESDEAFESAESDESDEAVSASARYRARVDTRNQKNFVKQNNVDQKREQQRANATQRSLTNQIKAIQPGTAAKVQVPPPLRGAGVVTARLPNGRTSRMQIIPPLAPVSEVNRLRSAITVNDRRQAVATASNSRAIQRLKVAQANAIRKLTAEQVKSDKDLRKRLVQGHNRLDKRISKALTSGGGAFDKHGKRMMRMIRRQRQRSVMNSVLLATSLPMFTAYGDSRKPHSKNNLILTGSLLGWMIGDELVDQARVKSGAVQKGANLWSWAAPAGNLATSYFLLRHKQHQRFVSGITALGPVASNASTLTIPLPLAKDGLEDFKVGPAVATVINGDGHVTEAVVSADGKLKLTVEGMSGTVPPQVAYVVDTQGATTVSA